MVDGKHKRGNTGLWRYVWLDSHCAHQGGSGGRRPVTGVHGYCDRKQSQENSGVIYFILYSAHQCLRD